MSKLNIYIIGSLLIGLICMGYWQSKTQYTLDIMEQNYRAASDSINVITLQNNKLLYEKNAYILKESELMDQINITKDEIKELKNKLKSSIDYITKIEGSLRIDTIYTNDTIYITKDTAYIHFDYNDLWLSLNGTTKLYDNKSQTIINKLTVPISIQTGLTEDYNIFIKTDNPYINIVELDGAVIRNNKFNPKFKHELQVGIGFQYGLFSQRLDFGPQVGYGFILEF